jgi:hypothetical protein
MPARRKYFTLLSYISTCSACRFPRPVATTATVVVVVVAAGRQNVNEWRVCRWVCGREPSTVRHVLADVVRSTFPHGVVVVLRRPAPSGNCSEASANALRAHTADCVELEVAGGAVPLLMVDLDER